MFKSISCTVSDFFLNEMPKQGYKIRQSQIDLASKIDAAIQKKENLLAEAGVGTGKTFAYLVPTLKYGTVLVSTNTISLQEQITEKDIPALQNFFDSKIKATAIKGKPQYFCQKNYDTNRKLLKSDEQQVVEYWSYYGGYDKSTLEGVSENSWKKISMDYQTDCSECRLAANCKTFEVRSKWKNFHNAYVTNHGQLIQILNQWSNNRENILEKPDCIVVDEAHQLIPLTQEFLTRRISVHNSIELFDSLQNIHEVSSGQLRKNCLLLESALEAILSELDQVEAINPEEEESNRFLIGSFPLSLLENIAYAGDLALFIQQELENLGKFPVTAYFLKTFIESCSCLIEPSTIKWIEFDGKNKMLCTLTEDPGRWLSKNLFDLGIPVVFISATLAVNNSFDYMLKKLDNAACNTFITSSPFDYDRQVKAEVLSTDTYSYQNQENYYNKTFEQVSKVISENHGNTLVLFTSKPAVLACKKYFQQNPAPYPIFFQEDTGVAQTVERFKTTSNSSLVGTAFWEGLDVPGDKLSAVIIPKLPFPQPDPLLHYEIEKAKQNYQDPFQEVIIPQMLLKLKQGVGRLIRSEKDQGRIVILDSRFLRSRIKWNQVLPFKNSL